MTNGNFSRSEGALTVFSARVADRNPRAMAGTATIGHALSRRLGLHAHQIGVPQPPLEGDWRAQLAAATPALSSLAQHVDEILSRNKVPITVMGRCAAAIATLPKVARHRADATIVWFDAHGDSNTPATSASGYLGGLVLTGASGAWDTGLGGELSLANVVLVGSRDLDPAERKLIDTGALQLVPPGSNLPQRLRSAITDGPIYVHLDCDVLNPGIVPTEYRVTGGLSLEDLRAACEALAGFELIGLEIAEYEDTWAESGKRASPVALLDALMPLLAKVC